MSGAGRGQQQLICIKVTEPLNGSIWERLKLARIELVRSLYVRVILCQELHEHVLYSP